jgi:hypothetical protein
MQANSTAAFGAIAATLPLWSVGYEDRINLGICFIWLDTRWVRKLSAMRGKDEESSRTSARSRAFNIGVSTY